MANSSSLFSKSDLRDADEDARCLVFSKELMSFASSEDTPLLAKVERWVSFLSGSSCAVERWNLRLLVGFRPEVADTLEELAVS
eukprot:IDg16267t1